MASKSPIIIEGGNLAAIQSTDTLEHVSLSATQQLLIPDVPSTTPRSLRLDTVANVLYANFSGTEVVVGTAGAAYVGQPVADEASLPASALDGEIRVTIDTGHVYTYDQTTSSWIRVGGLIKLPALDATIRSNGVTGDFVGQLIVSSDTLAVYAWNGSTWDRAGSAYVVKDTGGTEQGGVYEIYGTDTPSNYVPGTGLTFQLPASVSSILVAIPTVVLNSGYSSDDFSIDAKPIIDVINQKVIVRVIVGSHDPATGIIRYAELDPASSYGGIFAGNGIDSIVVRVLVQ